MHRKTYYIVRRSSTSIQYRFRQTPRDSSLHPLFPNTLPIPFPRLPSCCTFPPFSRRRRQRFPSANSCPRPRGYGANLSPIRPPRMPSPRISSRLERHRVKHVCVIKGTSYIPQYLIRRNILPPCIHSQRITRRLACRAARGTSTLDASTPRTRPRGCALRRLGLRAHLAAAAPGPAEPVRKAMPQAKPTRW